jgi:hypothetical protein
MKSTKKYLSTGVALAIALFAAIQVSAMAPQVNPYLRAGQKSYLENKINFEKELFNSHSAPSEERFRSNCREAIRQLEEVYYGNRPYTYDEVTSAGQEYRHS